MAGAHQSATVLSRRTLILNSTQYSDYLIRMEIILRYDTGLSGVNASTFQASFRWTGTSIQELN